MVFFLQGYGQLTMSTAENLAEGVSVSGTVNIPFHFYKTQLTGNGVIQIISQITNSSSSSAGEIIINVRFKDSTLLARKPIYILENTTVIDTFSISGAEQDEIYIAFQNYGVVYGGPFNYTTRYDLLYVEPNNELTWI